jgi:hypothetical protein
MESFGGAAERAADGENHEDQHPCRHQNEESNKDIFAFSSHHALSLPLALRPVRGACVSICR